MEVGVGGAWYVMIPRMVAGVWAVGVSWTNAVVETGVAMGVSQPASERRRPMARISQRTEEKCFKRFILALLFIRKPGKGEYVYSHHSICAEKIPCQRERIKLVEWIGIGTNPFRPNESGGDDRWGLLRFYRMH